MQDMVKIFDSCYRSISMSIFLSSRLYWFFVFVSIFHSMGGCFLGWRGWWSGFVEVFFQVIRMEIHWMRIFQDVISNVSWNSSPKWFTFWIQGISWQEYHGEDKCISPFFLRDLIWRDIFLDFILNINGYLLAVQVEIS